MPKRYLEAVNRWTDIFNGQNKKEKKKTNCRQNTAQLNKDWSTRTPLTYTFLNINKYLFTNYIYFIKKRDIKILCKNIINKTQNKKIINLT